MHQKKTRFSEKEWEKEVTTYSISTTEICRGTTSNLSAATEVANQRLYYARVAPLLWGTARNHLRPAVKSGLGGELFVWQSTDV